MGFSTVLVSTSRRVEPPLWFRSHIIPRKYSHFRCTDPYQRDCLKHSGLALAVGLAMVGTDNSYLRADC